MSAIDSGDACSCQPCGVTSTQRIQSCVVVGDPARRARRCQRATRARRIVGAPRDRGELLAALGVVLRARWRGDRARRASSSSAAAKPSRAAIASLRELAGHVAGGEAQLADRRRELGRRVGQLGHVARGGARGDLGVARELGSCPAVTCSPKNSVAVSGSWCASSKITVLHAGQQLGDAFVAQHHVGEEQVMVDDDDVGVERLLARLQHEAVAVERAVLRRGSCRAST